MPKPKKPNFDSSSLPSPKGITAKPAKMKDALPNFVRAGQTDKTGTNPSNPNVPRISYGVWMRGKPEQAVEYEKVSTTGKMRNAKCDRDSKYIEGDRGTCIPGGKKATSMPVKNEQLNTIMDSKNKNLKIGNAKKIEKYTK